MEIIIGLVIGTFMGLHILSSLCVSSDIETRLTKLERKRK
jgi:hypothetical protein